MKINDPPEVVEILKASVGVDSIHVLIKMNKFDLIRFCEYKKYSYKSKVNFKYQRKWLIFLPDGEPVTATYYYGSQTIKLEIGKLLNYTENKCRYEFIQQIILYFSDRKISIGRIDIAVDINKKRDDLIIKNLSKLLSSERVNSTTYNNAKGHVFIAYEKSYQLKLYSTYLTRLEVRLNTQLASWKITDFLSNRDSFEKLVKKVSEYFKNKVEIYSNNRLEKYTLNIDVNSVLSDFIEFIHGGIYKYKDHFRIKEAIVKRDKFINWMKVNNLTPQKINCFVKGRRAAVCKELGLDPKTFKKAVCFYKAIPNFKF